MEELAMVYTKFAAFHIYLAKKKKPTKKPEYAFHPFFLLLYLW